MTEQQQAAIQRVRDDIASGGVWMPNLNDVLILLDALDALSLAAEDALEDIDYVRRTRNDAFLERAAKVLVAALAQRSQAATATPQPAASPATTDGDE